MYAPLKQHHINYVASVPSVNNEFTDKVRELDHRLQKNGLAYKDWDTMTDRQQGIFSQNLFLDGGCASSVQDYVEGAAHSCEPCAAEELHHHSPALMQAIDDEKEKLPDLTINIGEGLDKLNEFIDSILLEQPPRYNPEDSSPLQKAAGLYKQAHEAALKYLTAANPQVAVKGEDGYPPKSAAGGQGRGKAWAYTNTLGPRSARVKLLEKITADPAFKGATVTYNDLKPWLGFDAAWDDGLEYKLRISKGGAKGIGNKGDIFEGVLATAFYLRFLNPDEEDISPEAVASLLIKMGGAATQTGKKKEYSTSKTKDNNGQPDEYSLAIGLAQGVFNDMTAVDDGEADLEDIKQPVPAQRALKFDTEIQGLIKLAAQAVDIPSVKTLATSLANNEKVDTVQVAAIGLDDQSGTKADLKITINDRNAIQVNADDDNANAVLSKIGQLSVKYTSTLLGQTGKSWVSKGKSIGIKDNIKMIFGIDIDPSGKKEAEWNEILGDPLVGKEGGGDMIKQKLSELVMKPVFDYVSPILKGKDDPKKLEQLLDGIEKGVRYAATKGDKGIGFVAVGKDKSSGALTARYLDWYDKLYEVISRKGKDEAGNPIPRTPTDPKTGKPINLEIAYKTQGNPMLLFYDASVGGEPSSAEDDNVMFYYRGKPESEGQTFRTYIQYGNRLQDLVEISEDEAMVNLDKAIAPAQ
tara:strand:+ start:2042 stop:4123 length:2082 start_codon:yes stop_codon:yes gene_type:complete